MMFNFTLDPIDQVAPWDDPPNLSLSWFGLTSGSYFLQAGPDQLLRYSDECQARLASAYPAAVKSPYVEYQVSRLYEDAFNILPYVLEPIPTRLVELARSQVYWEWHEVYREWMEAQPESDESASDRYYDAVGWLGQRSLDTCYLSPNARIWFWRLGDTVTVEWDNRDKYFEDIPAWAAQQGSYSLPVEQFQREVSVFFDSLFDAMEQRVAEVCRSWSRPEVRIDFEQLRAEQLSRRAEIKSKRANLSATDWARVIDALTVIQQSTGTRFGPS